jgi:hypothetical protein
MLRVDILVRQSLTPIHPEAILADDLLHAFRVCHRSSESSESSESSGTEFRSVRELRLLRADGLLRRTQAAQALLNLAALNA